MENASKALIIAGAILLSILIISLGIVVVTNARSTIDKANVDQTEAETFNSKFEAYVGDKKTMSEVKACISAVNSSQGGTHKIDVYFPSGSKITGTMPSGLSTGVTYKIEVKDSYKADGTTSGQDGYVDTVTITQN